MTSKGDIFSQTLVENSLEQDQKWRDGNRIELNRMNTVFPRNKSRLFSTGAANMIYAAYCRAALHNLGAATPCSEFMLNLNGEADMWH